MSTISMTTRPCPDDAPLLALSRRLRSRLLQPELHPELLLSESRSVPPINERLLYTNLSTNLIKRRLLPTRLYRISDLLRDRLLSAATRPLRWAMSSLLSGNVVFKVSHWQIQDPLDLDPLLVTDLNPILSRSQKTPSTTLDLPAERDNWTVAAPLSVGLTLWDVTVPCLGPPMVALLAQDVEHSGEEPELASELSPKKF